MIKTVSVSTAAAKTKIVTRTSTEVTGTSIRIKIGVRETSTRVAMMTRSHHHHLPRIRREIIKVLLRITNQRTRIENVKKTDTKVINIVATKRNTTVIKINTGIRYS